MATTFPRTDAEFADHAIATLRDRYEGMVGALRVMPAHMRRPHREEYKAIQGALKALKAALDTHPRTRFEAADAASQRVAKIANPDHEDSADAILYRFTSREDAAGRVVLIEAVHAEGIVLDKWYRTHAEAAEFYRALRDRR